MNLVDTENEPTQVRVLRATKHFAQYLEAQAERQSTCICASEPAHETGAPKALINCPCQLDLTSQARLRLRCNGTVINLSASEKSLASGGNAVFIVPMLKLIDGVSVRVHPNKLGKNFNPGVTVAAIIARSFMPDPPLGVADRWVVSCSNFSFPTVRNTCFLPMKAAEFLGTMVPTVRRKPRSPNMTHQDLCDIAARSQDGETFTAIADALGRGYQQVYNAVTSGKAGRALLVQEGLQTESITLLEDEDNDNSKEIEVQDS